MSDHHSDVVAPEAPGRSRILEAAKQLFADEGYGATSMQDIARRAGTSKANVFHHFGSKAELYKAVLAAVVEIQQRQLAQLQTDSSEDALTRYIRIELDDMFSDPAMVRLFMRQMLSEVQDPQRAQAEDTLVRTLVTVRDSLLPLVREDNDQTDPGSGDLEQRALVLAMTLLGTNYVYFQLRDVWARQTGEAMLDVTDYSRLLAESLASTLDSNNGQRQDSGKHGL